MDFISIGDAYGSALQQAAAQMGISVNLLVFIITLITTWIFVWKGLALWKAAQKKQKIIFVLLLILNDFGIIELIYYFWLSKIGENRNNSGKRVKKKK